jgi:hypothetical protein
VSQKGTTPMTEIELTYKRYRALRDMADGHLTLYASIEHFDGHTGEQLPEPRLLYVGHDRPDIFDQDWWKPLLAAGLISLPQIGCGNRCTVTLDGHQTLATHR